MSTVAEVRAALATGDAYLRYVKTNEAWYYIPRRESWVQAEWSVGVDSHEGGTYGEWELLLGELSDRKPAVQHQLFDDSLAALLCVPGYWDPITNVTLGYWEAMEKAGGDPEKVEAALIALGFSDQTSRTRPE